MWLGRYRRHLLGVDMIEAVLNTQVHTLATCVPHEVTLRANQGILLEKSCTKL